MNEENIEMKAKQFMYDYQEKQGLLSSRQRANSDIVALRKMTMTSCPGSVNDINELKVSLEVDLV